MKDLDIPAINVMFHHFLVQRKESVHKGVRYCCDQCDISAFTQADNLRQHKASVHEGLRYTCDQCDVSSFTHSNTLRRHIASKHEGVRYECDKCDYKAKQGSLMRIHSKRYHYV